MILSICSVDSCSLNEGMISEKPRKDPPLVIIARQVESGSGEVLGQSEKSGKLEGGKNPRMVCGSPLPSVGASQRHEAILFYSRSTVPTT